MSLVTGQQSILSLIEGIVYSIMTLQGFKQYQNYNIIFLFRTQRNMKLNLK